MVTNNGSSFVRRIRRLPRVHPLEIPDEDLQRLLFISDIMDLEDDGHITPRVSKFIIDLFNERIT